MYTLDMSGLTVIYSMVNHFYYATFGRSKILGVQTYSVPLL